MGLAHIWRHQIHTMNPELFNQPLLDSNRLPTRNRIFTQALCGDRWDVTMLPASVSSSVSRPSHGYLLSAIFDFQQMGEYSCVVYVGAQRWC